MKKKGGARPGAGRKPGVSDRPKLINYWNEADVVAYFDYLKKNYKKSDRLATFVGEQLMGKAVQPIDANMTGKLSLTFDNAFTPRPKGNSGE